MIAKANADARKQLEHSGIATVVLGVWDFRQEDDVQSKETYQLLFSKIIHH